MALARKAEIRLGRSEGDSTSQGSGRKCIVLSFDRPMDVDAMVTYDEKLCSNRPYRTVRDLR
jgi:hypothetical protein